MPLFDSELDTNSDLNSNLGSDDESATDDDGLTGQMLALGINDDLPCPIVLPSERASIHDFRYACGELQIQNTDFRHRIHTLLLEVARYKQEIATTNSKPKTASQEVPKQYERHAKGIMLICRKSAIYFHPWPEERWLQSARRPDVDLGDVDARYRSKKSQELGMIAELYDYFRANPISISLVDFIGREPWFASAFCKAARDQKCKALGPALQALPLVVTLPGDAIYNLLQSAAARRADPRLQQLRGRSFDKFPLVYYRVDPENPTKKDSKYLFWVPEIGYYFRAALYGPSSLPHERPRSTSNGIKWRADVEGVTPASLAFMFVMLRFHVSGEKDFAPDGPSTSRGDNNSDPQDDAVNWLEEYSRLRRMFDEKWNTPGMKQIAAAVYAVAFEGQNPLTIQRDEGDDPERARVELENEQALLSFGSVIPADNQQPPSRSSPFHPRPESYVGPVDPAQEAARTLPQARDETEEEGPSIGTSHRAEEAPPADANEAVSSGRRKAAKSKDKGKAREVGVKDIAPRPRRTTRNTPT